MCSMCETAGLCSGCGASMAEGGPEWCPDHPVRDEHAGSDRAKWEHVPWKRRRS